MLVHEKMGRLGGSQRQSELVLHLHKSSEAELNMVCPHAPLVGAIAGAVAIRHRGPDTGMVRLESRIIVDHSGKEVCTSSRHSPCKNGEEVSLRVRRRGLTFLCASARRLTAWAASSKTELLEAKWVSNLDTKDGSVARARAGVPLDRSEYSTRSRVGV